MIKTVLIPIENTLHLSIPNKYIGKEIEILVYSKDELVEENPVKGSSARFKGLLTHDEADKFHQHIKQARSEWNRDI